MDRFSRRPRAVWIAPVNGVSPRRRGLDQIRVTCGARRKARQTLVSCAQYPRVPQFQTGERATEKRELLRRVMSAHGPPGKRKARPQACSSQFELQLRSSGALSIVARRRSRSFRATVLAETPLCRWAHRRERLRRCCVYGIVVRNRNLGGFSGRSALSGRLFCLHCEDLGGAK
jgi:hypothetical protein